MKNYSAIFFLLLITFDLFGDPTISIDDKERSEKIFSLKIRNILSSKCVSCHGNDNKLKGGLDLTSMAGMMAGGDSGDPAVVAGKPHLSPLFLSTLRQKKGEWEAMPPKENDKLEKEQVNSLQSWIELGAHWPNE